MKSHIHKFFIKPFIAFLMMAAIVTMISCGGGGGGGDGDDNSDTSGGDTGEGGQESPAFTGFDFDLNQGYFWEYGWDYSSSYVASGSSSSSNYQGTFRVTLGPPVAMDDMTFYEMQISGTTDAGNRKNLKPRGTYVAVSENKIVILAADMTTIETLFDAQTGLWPGSGFFTEFPTSTLFSAILSTISNDYINESAYMVRESASESQCEYFPGYGNICGGDYNENMDEREYYIDSVGPAGYYAYFSMSDWSSPDGGWSASNTTHIGLTASTLWNDSLDYTLEVEPNNQIAEATPINIPARVKGKELSETYLGGTTAVSVGLSPITEIEPNDSPFSPQIVNLLSSITADVENGTDLFTSVTVSPSPGAPTYVATFEDWYEVTVGTGATLNANLDFPGTGADLDMYLFSLEPDNSVEIFASSTDDNVGLGTDSEEMSQFVPTDTYYIAVDAFVTPSGRADYTLEISTGNSQVDICDWFSFSLVSQAQVNIAATGGPTFVLMDATGVNTLASGGAIEVSTMLSAGSYLVGVGTGGEYTLEVTSP